MVSICCFACAIAAVKELFETIDDDVRIHSAAVLYIYLALDEKYSNCLKSSTLILSFLLKDNSGIYVHCWKMIRVVLNNLLNCD